MCNCNKHTPEQIAYYEYVKYWIDKECPYCSQKAIDLSEKPLVKCRRCGNILTLDSSVL